MFNLATDDNALKPTSTELYASLSNDLCQQGYSIVRSQETLNIAQPLAQVANQIDETIFHRAGIGRQQDFQMNREIRKDKVFWLDEDVISFKLWFDWLEGFKAHLNRELFLGLNGFETHVSLYQPGDFYQRHQDAFQGQSNRRVTTILYLNHDWHVQHGGELILFNRENQPIQVIPELGTLVVFLSDEFPHEVKVTQRERLTLTSWMRVDPPLAGLQIF